MNDACGDLESGRLDRLNQTPFRLGDRMRAFNHDDPGLIRRRRLRLRAEVDAREGEGEPDSGQDWSHGGVPPWFQAAARDMSGNLAAPSAHLAKDYYGDEVGLSDVAIPAFEVQDPRELREPGFDLGRDPVRTPMPWDGSGNAGFTTARPWLPLNADWPTRNVARLAGESRSILTLHRQLLAVRRAHPALSIGDFTLLDAEGDVLAYARRHGAERLIVALNLGTRPHRLELPAWASHCRALLSTLADFPLVEDGVLLLRADEGVILTVD